MPAQLTVAGSRTRRQPSAQARKKASGRVSCRCSMSSSSISISSPNGPVVAGGLTFKALGSAFEPAESGLCGGAGVDWTNGGIALGVLVAVAGIVAAAYVVCEGRVGRDTISGVGGSCPGRVGDRRAALNCSSACAWAAAIASALSLLNLARSTRLLAVTSSAVRPEKDSL